MSETSTERERAEAHRSVVEPLWTEPVFEEVAADLPLTDEGTQLVAESRSGYVPIELRGYLDDDVRMIALDSESAMLDVARERAEQRGIDDIFFVPERVDEVSYADGVFDAAVCLHGLVTARQAEEGVAELARVTADGGRIGLVVPLATSFQLFYDMLDESLRANGLEERLDRVDGLRDRLVSPTRLAGIADEAGLEIDSVGEMSWTVEFDQGRELIYSPLVRETFFPHWMGIVSSAKRDDVLRYIGDAVDTYWHDREFECNVDAGLLLATVPES